MDSNFLTRVRAAAVAAWWTLLVALVFFAAQWLIYLLAMSTKPTWVLFTWGPEATWDSIRPMWFYTLVFLKLSLWPLALVALWLTVWARQLRTHRPSA